MKGCAPAGGARDSGRRVYPALGGRPVPAGADAQAWIKKRTRQSLSESGVRKVLRRLEEWSNRALLPDALVERLDVLTKGMEAGERGFREQLFLRSIQGHPLKLRKNSIFFPKACDPATVSQADVFLCVSATLHKLRGEPAGPETLGRGLRHHALLDPANFERFTDGVIQASFLRAALPVELDYTVDTGASGSMAEFLRAMFRNPEAQGEAALEFAMAIATRRLCLTATDQQSLQRQWEEDSSKYPDALRTLVDLTRGAK